MKKIVSAAAKIYLNEACTKWAIIPLHRHKDLGTILGALQIEIWESEDGFLTNKGDFLDRKRALECAVACGQVDPESPVGEDIVKSGILFSEDLW